MNISFRQGLVQTPDAPWLQLNAYRVSIVLGAYQAITITFADNTTDYLVTIPASVPNAWPNTFSPGFDSWLYFDIDVVIGHLTYGSTRYLPIVSDVQPTAPVIDQHWFDPSMNRMYVWIGGAWIHKIRVFAAKLSQGTVFESVSINTPAYTGTQAGEFTSTPTNVGAIVYDSKGFVIKKGDGTFFTTEDIALTGVATASQVKIGSIVVNAVSTANFPAYTVVRFTNFNEISPATNSNSQVGTYGIVQAPAYIDDIVAITMEGLVTNVLWDWTAVGVNAPLYIDVNGLLTSIKSPAGTIIAAVVGINTIMMLPALSFSGASTQAGLATKNTIGSVKLSVSADIINSPIVVGVNDPHFVNALQTTGGVMTGPLTLSSNPTSALQPTTKQYVDALFATLSANAGVSYSKQNNDVNVMSKGTPVYSSGVGMVSSAVASSGVASLVIGLVSDIFINPGSTGFIQSADILTATIFQWNALTGSSVGLIEGSIYYLDPNNPGVITDIPPTATTQYLVEVGIALSATQLAISIQPPILL
jgi:hypothetical protein